MAAKPLNIRRLVLDVDKAISSPSVTEYAEGAFTNVPDSLPTLESHLTSLSLIRALIPDAFPHGVDVATLLP